MANLQDLKDQLRNKQSELEDIKNDMNEERKKGGSLSSLYEAKNICQGEIDSLNKEFKRCENKGSAPQNFFDHQTILSTAVVRRKIPRELQVKSTPVTTTSVKS